MHGLKSAIWQFFRNRQIGWIGHSQIVQPFKMAREIFFSLFSLDLFFKYKNHC